MPTLGTKNAPKMGHPDFWQVQMWATRPFHQSLGLASYNRYIREGEYGPTMDEILISAPGVLTELAREFTRRGDEEYRKDEKSQASACFFLALRSISLLCGMGRLLKPETRDSVKVLMRGFLESRDLLMTFRFDDQGIRNKIGIWFKGDVGTTWKAEHTRCEGYLDKLGYKGSDFAKKWSQTTTLAHPTRFASQNSVNCVTLWAATPRRQADFNDMMEPEVADYLTSIATLIVLATHDLPGLISLGCDLNRMPNIDQFRANVFSIVVPILNKRDSDLPPGSYRS
jgi:hypothetical protein